MPVDFPTSPSVNQIYTYQGKSWQWNGYAWDVYPVDPNSVTYLNGFTGNVTISGGTAINIANSLNTITVSYTGTGGGGGGDGGGGGGGPVISDSGGDIVINPAGMIFNSIPAITNLGPTGSTAYILHLNPFHVPKGCTITRIVTLQGSPCTGHTGSLMFAVYDIGITNGLPNNLLYASLPLQINKVDYSRYVATPNVNIQAGSYWIGYLMDRTGVTQSMSWSTTANKANSWDAYANGGRFFNNGTMVMIRYRLDGFTLASKLTAGFSSAISYGISPAINFGNSETVNDNSAAWVGISVQQ